MTNRLAGRNGFSAVVTLFISAVVFLDASGGAFAAPPVKIRVGHFPNMTHAQALIAQTNDWFALAVRPDAVVEWKTFNAGPTVIQALFAGELDLAYIGPGPAINSYVKTKGRLPIVIAGAADGGAALVVRPDAGIHTAADFRGKRIATPQIGNTQDIAFRGWLKAHGLAPTEKGGDVNVMPVANPDQFTLFRQGQIDGAWAPEPWAARLVHEAGGTVFLDERDLWQPLTDGAFATTVLIAHPTFLQEHPDLVRRWVMAHAALTAWINGHPTEAKALVNSQLKHLTGKLLPREVLDSAWERIRFTVDPIQESIAQTARWAFEEGYLGRIEPDVSGLVDTRWIPAETSPGPKK